MQQKTCTHTQKSKSKKQGETKFIGREKKTSCESEGQRLALALQIDPSQAWISFYLRGSLVWTQNVFLECFMIFQKYFVFETLHLSC